MAMSVRSCIYRLARASCASRFRNASTKERRFAAMKTKEFTKQETNQLGTLRLLRGLSLLCTVPLHKR
jgi:hypothetical protein